MSLEKISEKSTVELEGGMYPVETRGNLIIVEPTIEVVKRYQEPVYRQEWKIIRKKGERIRFIRTR